MAGGYDLIAFHDTRAAHIAMITVSGSGAIAEYLPKLAEKAGLGAPITGKPFSSGVHHYENGEIHVEKERY